MNHSRNFYCIKNCVKISFSTEIEVSEKCLIFEKSLKNLNSLRCNKINVKFASNFDIFNDDFRDFSLLKLLKGTE